MTADEQEDPSNNGSKPLIPGYSFEPATVDQPNIEQGRSSQATDRNREERRDVGDGVPNGEEGATPEEVDGGKGRNESQPRDNGLSWE